MHRPSALLLVLAITALTACGSDDSGGSGAKDNAAATTTSKLVAPAAATTTSKLVAPAPATTTPSPPRKTSASDCRQAYDPFIAELRHLNSDVAGTPSYKVYVAATRKLVTDYTKVGAIAGNSRCQRVVVPPTVKAYFTHLTAAYSWQQCQQRHNCADSMALLKRKWHRATRLTNQADKALNKLTTA